MESKTGDAAEEKGQKGVQVRIRFTAGVHATEWKETRLAGDGVQRAIFERTEFGPRTDIPTDFIIEIEGVPFHPGPQDC